MVFIRYTGHGGYLLQRFLISQASIQGRGNAWRACLGKISRKQYLRHYPVRLIRPDGSSIEIRYLEPRSVVQLPLDLNSLSEEEKRQRLAARKPKAKKIVQEKIDDNFDASEYMRFWNPQESSTQQHQQTQQSRQPQQTIKEKQPQQPRPSDNKDQPMKARKM